MRIVETFKNIWKIEELRTRILWTLGLVAIYRLGCFIVLPGIDASLLDELHNQTRGGLMALLDMFSGGAFSNASIFALGIMPYISAAIIIQLLTMVLPSLRKLSMEGESGRNKINQYTRLLTVVVLIFQSFAYLTNLRYQIGPAIVNQGWWFNFSSIIILTAGSMFVMWLGERITDKGIGNGISFLIMIGIIARFPTAISQEFVQAASSTGNLVLFLLEIVFLLIVIGISILLVQGTRKVPVQYAKQIRGNRQYGGVRQYIPLKVNAAGVMPIIFAQAIMFIPLVFAGFASQNTASFWSSFFDNTTFTYNFVFAILIIVFTYFYTAITMNPQQMSDAIKSQNGFIPGIKPGKKTTEFLDKIMSRITLPGSIFLAFVAILPCFARILGVTQEFSQFFGGTSLLILVGVILDTLQQIESHLMMHHYDGLMKNGKIKGRTGSVAAY